MYLLDIKLTQIKCFKEIELSFAGANGRPRRWTTLLGQNGCGKSTLLQAIALGLAGPETVRDLGPLFDGWQRVGQTQPAVFAGLSLLRRDTDSQVSAHDVEDPGTYVQCDVRLQPGAVVSAGSSALHPGPITDWVWSPISPRYFCAGYGPYRRFFGISPDLDKLVKSGRRSARLMTLFREDAAISDLEEWLVFLHNTEQERSSENGVLLNQVRTLLAQDFLPEAAVLTVDARRAQLQVGGRASVNFGQLSDGYRSMLSLGLDLFRRLAEAFPGSGAPQREPGVVLIDELDAHLHPRWQQTIGKWLLEKFPNLQFIVATHSPFLAQVSEEAGGNIILEQQPDGTVKARSDAEAVHTWRSDQVLTELFGLTSTRTPVVQEQLTEYLALEMRRREGKLSAEELQRHQDLEKIYRTIPPPIEDPVERRRAEALRAAIEANKTKIGELE